MKLKLYTPTSPQVEAKELELLYLPYILFMAYGRQTGKTYHMMMDMLNRALSYDSSEPALMKRILWVSPIMQQSNKIFEGIEKLFVQHQEVWDLIIKRYDRRDHMIEFYNGAVIQFGSADQGDNLRGDTIKHTYVDEVAFMNFEFIEKVLMPMHTRTKGRFTWGSTFNGRNWAWDAYVRGQNPKNRDHIVSILRTYKDLDDPDVTRTVLAIKENMSKSAFDQEYLCKPVSAGAVFSNINECTGFKPPKDGEFFKVYLGMDIGVRNDYTVLTAMDENYRCLDIERFNPAEDNLTSQEVKDRIVEFYRKWDSEYEMKIGEQKIMMPSRLESGHFEVNGQELLYKELVEDYDLYKLIPISLQNKNKSEMIDLLIKLFEDKQIQLPESDELIQEFEGFESRQNKVTGIVTYGNNSKNAAHDDIVLSIAHACWCAHEEGDGGTTQFM